MRSLIGLKNVIIFSAVLLTIGSVSAQQAFAGNLIACDLTSIQDEDWDSAFNQIPTSSDNVCIENEVQLNGVGLANNLVIIREGSLFIGCDGDLTVDFNIHVFTLLINHGSVDADSLNNEGLVQNSSSDFTFNSIFGPGTFEDISTKCSQLIGGTVGSMSTTSLLVAGAQANMGLLSLALVGMVAAGAAITYKLKSKKTEQ